MATAFAVPQTLPRANPRAVSAWLFGMAALVFAMVVVGGITRLTESGLSMVHWHPLADMVPPHTPGQWQAEYAAYAQSPQGRLVNAHMGLARFQTIYFWEWAHRLLGRIVGFAFALPLAWFAWRREIPAGYGPRLALLLVLGGMQGAVGWWMVYSGLIDRPAVAHERLATHLVLALLLMVALLWTALELRASTRLPAHGERHGRAPTRWIAPFVALLLLQIVYGAFVAGLRAGWFVNTWPLMEGHLVHPEAWAAARRSALAWIDDPVAVQTVHRKLALLVAGAALWAAWALRRAGLTRPALALAGVVALQFTLGVLTLVNQVPVALGVLHQAGAALLVLVTTWAAHACLAARARTR